MNFSFAAKNIQQPKFAPGANKRISVSYDVKSVFDGIRKILLKI